MAIRIANKTSILIVHQSKGMLKIQTAPVFAKAVTLSRTMSVNTLYDFVSGMFKVGFAIREKNQHEGQGYARLRDA